MLRLWIKVCLFFSAYSPLFIIMILRSTENLWVILIGLAVIFIGNAIWLKSISLARKKTIRQTKVQLAENRTSESLSYIVGYVFGLVNFNFDRFLDIISVGVLIFVLYTIYINSDLIFVNPIMNLFGYKLFKAQTDKNERIIILSKSDILPGDKVELQDLSSGIYLAKECNK